MAHLLAGQPSTNGTGGWPAKHTRVPMAGQPSTLNVVTIFAVSLDCVRVSAKVDTNMTDGVIVTKSSRSTH